MKKCGCDNCLECPHDDCILEQQRIEAVKAYQKRYRETHKAQAKIAQAAWFQEHKKEHAQHMKYLRMLKNMEKINKCEQCGKKVDAPCYVLKYKRMYFCSEQCLGEYMVAEADTKGLIKDVWKDTPENIKICMLEDRENE